MPTFNQTINGAHVRRETLDGREYVVAPITILKPMTLNAPAGWDESEAYLPTTEAAASAPSWNGTPLTLNHPTVNGTGTSANTPAMHQKTVLGRVFNARFDDTLDAEAWFDVAKIRDMGGAAEQALDDVLNGDTVEVSSGYRAHRLPPGEYDGASYGAVQGNIRPDHVAVLPNQQGKCPVEAGCGVGAAVANDADAGFVVTNADVTIADDPPGEDDGDSTNAGLQRLTFDATSEGTLDESAIPTDDFESHYVFPGETKSESSFPLVDAEGRLRRGNVAAAFRFRDDAPDREQLLDVLAAANDEFDDPPIDPESLRDAMSENAATGGAMFDWLRNFLGRDVSTPNESAEPDTSQAGDPPAHETSMNRDDLIDDITENSEITRESLEGMGDTCLQTTHDHVVGNDGTDADGNADDSPDSDTTETTTTTDTDTDTATVDESRIAEIAATAATEAVDARLAENQRQDLIDDIVANSDEYERADLTETPESVLRNIRDDVSDPAPAANFGATRGAGAQPATNSDDHDADDLVMFGSDA